MEWLSCDWGCKDMDPILILLFLLISMLLIFGKKEVKQFFILLAVINDLKNSLEIPIVYALLQLQPRILLSFLYHSIL